MKTKEFSAICPIDFDTVFDSYNYAIAHRLDANPLAVATPTNMRCMDFLHSLVSNGVRVFAIWSDELDDSASEYVYTTEAGAREAMEQIEANDKDPGYMSRIITK